MLNPSYKPSSFGKYLNIGCDLKNDSRIEGLTELKNEPNEFGITDTFGVASSLVDRIFICGKVDVKETVTVISANEIYLKDVQLLKEKSLGLISINTDLLSLDGNNLILTSGFDDVSPGFLSAPSIKLAVYEKVEGTGLLEFKSIGGNAVTKAAK